MAATKKPVSLILAAAVPSMGIGLNGTLPWNLSKEMAYFRQVTTKSVVIMGKTTWESIPLKFRPLKNRVNVVISSTLYKDNSDIYKDDQALNIKNSPVLYYKNFDTALNHIDKLYSDLPIYVIGGVQLYTSVLDHERVKNVLLTEVKKISVSPEDSSQYDTIECDSFFTAFPWYPKNTDKISIKQKEWIRQSFDSLKAFVPEAISLENKPISENGFEYEFTLWNRNQQN